MCANKIVILMTGTAFLRSHAVTLRPTPDVHCVGMPVVTLTGKVPDRQAQQRAQAVAAAVPGVATVRNDIDVGAGRLRAGSGPGPIPDKMPGAH